MMGDESLELLQDPHSIPRWRHEAIEDQLRRAQVAALRLPSIPAVPALDQKSQTADEQRTTKEHGPLPDIETEKPAIGHSCKSHGRPLFGMLRDPNPGLGVRARCSGHEARQHGYIQARFSTQHRRQRTFRLC
jgi:hypothetical protein